MAIEKERMQILEMIAEGKISAVDGVKLLNAMEDSESDNEETSLEISEQGPLSVTPAPETETVSPSTTPHWTAGEITEPFSTTSPPVIEDEARPAQEKEEFARPVPPTPLMEKWRRWRWVPVWIGVGITVFGSFLMYWAFTGTGFSFWFACSWIPFLIGVGLLALSWSSRTLRWLHIRIRQAPGVRPQRISISLPLPLGLIAWALRTFGDYIPNMDAAGVNGMILALENTSTTSPFYLEIDEGDNGERVEIFVG